MQQIKYSLGCDKLLLGSQSIDATYEIQKYQLVNDDKSSTEQDWITNWAKHVIYF